jgi:uncharacterized protein YidB (DUF937 family)
MSLLDTVSSLLGNNSSPEGSKNLIHAALEFINSQPGGLSGLIQRFHEKGAGEIVNSWVGNGANQAISPETLQGVLGSDALSGIAQQAGVSADQVSGLLSQMLPHVINSATPDGQVPAGGKVDLSSVLGSLGGNAGLASIAGKLFGNKEA